ncbi:hypothetical protein [Mucilaginibacter agri]|uniref:Uncharacterized protein n=1 Tax=Mucilaginibacter agri TaxID=2695265 RepID=A0A965ZIU8_9SPHI|nr:hypothetical protein [Mucilaginibacter agri]NCD70918.1 hypothetical protein [Mucilaginibacter agri]
MKNLRNHVILILTVYLIGNVNLAHAQSANHDAYYKTGERDMHNTLFSKFDTLRRKRIDTCLTAAIFAQFTISSKGKVSNVQLFGSKTALAAYGNEIKFVVESTDGNWAPQTFNHKAVESDPIVQPVFIKMEDCPPNSTSDTFRADILSFFSIPGKKIFRKINMLSPLVFEANR